ncbi:MAG: hypothetical protein K6G62_03990 [Eubacterium sp.]|nr:hypothetical protein [Eubacterium sp.]
MLKAVRTMLIIILNIIFYAVVLFAGIQICQKGYSFSYDVLGDTVVEVPPGEDRAITVTETESTMEVLGELEDKHVIKDRYSLYVRLMLEEKNNKKIPAGVYMVNSSMTYGEVIQTLYPESES